MVVELLEELLEDTGAELEEMASTELDSTEELEVIAEEDTSLDEESDEDASSEDTEELASALDAGADSTAEEILELLLVGLGFESPPPQAIRLHDSRLIKKS